MAWLITKVTLAPAGNFLSTVYSKWSTLTLFQVFEDAACEREVLNLCVKCPSQGCPWTGELRNVKVKREVRISLEY